MSDMTRFTDHMNMSSYEDECIWEYERIWEYESESDYGGYSDADLRDEELGDRYAEDVKQTEIENEMEQAEEERKYKASLLQHPDEMEFIRPARKLVSVEEMNAWFYSLLNAEAEARVRAWAVPIIEAWWKRCLIAKAKKAEEKRMEWRRQELAEWKKVRTPRRGISQLGPLVIFENEYALMRECRNNHRLIKAGIEERVQSAKAKADAIVAAERAAIRNRKAGKARAQAKKGMNKNTTWHKARESGSLAIKTKSPAPISDEGKGKRAQRKIRQEKERQEAAEHAARLQEEKKAAFVFVDLKDERTDEEKAAEEAEEAELEEALRRMNRACVEKISQQEAQEAQAQAEAKAAGELKANEEAELAEFVAVMSKNRKPNTKKVVIELGFKSLKEQKIEQRRATDEKFNARCEGFKDLSSKEKLAEVLKFTSLCRSVASKKKCYHKDCRFAHSIDQLQQKDCRFGLGCKFVKKMENGQYENAKFGHTGKTCSCMHPGEHKRGFCIRMGLKYVPGESEKIQEVKPSTVFTSAPIKAPGVPSVWAKVVSAAETAEKVAECKAKMTKAWSTVVVDTLTEEKKAEIYGKGVELLGAVSEECDSVPIIPSTIRKTCDKRGLCFFDQEQKTSTKLLVTTPGFSWVKGAVLEPEQKKRWDPRPVLDPVIVKVAAAVQAINDRVAKIQTADIERRVRNAKAKAAEITKRLAAIEKKTWTKVEGRKSVRGVTKEPEVTVLRVPRADAELALLGAIRNGLTNFRIEYTDAPPKPERSGKKEEEYQDERCDRLVGV